MRISRSIIGIGAAAILAAGPAATPAAAASGVGPCEKALAVCLLRPGHNLPWDIVSCLQGYEFCKRYIEPLF